MNPWVPTAEVDVGLTLMTLRSQVRDSDPVSHQELF